MVDYNFSVPTVQPMQQPNMMQAYGQMQQIQANRMMMEERTRALQEQNALRSLLAGGIKVGTPEFTEGAARISPELGLKAETSRLANVREQRTAEAQQAQAENARVQSMRTLGQIGADKVSQYRNSLAMIDPSDPAAYGAFYSVAAPEFKKVGATLPPPDRWNAQIKGTLLQTADSFLNVAKETAPGVQMVEGIPYQRTVEGGQIRLTPIQPTQEGVPSQRFGIAPVDGTTRPLQTPVNPALNTMTAVGGAPITNALVQPPAETFEQIKARTEAEKQAREVQTFGLKEREKAKATKETEATEQTRQLDQAIRELENVVKPGGLIAKSTGSLPGQAVDYVLGKGLGYATPGAIAGARLQPIADVVLKMVPRFEGPQSDKDTQSYKEAAGQIADTSLPAATRQAAGKEILRLMRSRRDQFTMATGEGMPATRAAAPTGNAALSVTAPNGVTYTFSDPAKAAEFRQKAGL